MRYLNVFTNHGEEVAVPNLIGLSAVDAKLKLESLGLSYEVLDSIPYLLSLARVAKLTVSALDIKENPERLFLR